jgi:hypothetical protein
MQRYFATLHKRTPAYKKRFALLVSSSFTLFIFGVWSFANFGGETRDVVAVKSRSSVEETLAVGDVKEESPFKLIRENLASSIDGIGALWGNLTSGVKSVDLEAEYNELRGGALEIYGQ